MRKKIQQMNIIQSSNNQIVYALRSAQKFQVWNTYKPVEIEVFKEIPNKSVCVRRFLRCSVGSYFHKQEE